MNDDLTCLDTELLVQPPLSKGWEVSYDLSTHSKRQLYRCWATFQSLDKAQSLKLISLWAMIIIEVYSCKKEAQKKIIKRPNEPS